MAEFLRLKLMPLENKLKAAQSSEYDNQTIPIQYGTQVTSHGGIFFYLFF